MKEFIPKMARHQPFHQQVEEYIRSKIVSGDMAPGSKLPSNQVLAEATGTSVFTVQTALSKLRKEGLIERKQKVGTFVTGNKVNLRCVGIYFGADLWINAEMGFYQSLYKELQNRYSEQGVEVKTWIDDRPVEHQTVVFPSLKTAIDRRDIQALIAPMVNGFDIKWLTKVPIAAAIVSLNKVMNNRVSYDWRQMMRAGLESLKAQGCNTVGLISSVPLETKFSSENSESIDFYNYFIESVRYLGLETVNAWIRSAESSSLQKQNFGYEQFNAIWDQDVHPQGLLVWPDHVASGVLMAILNRQVSVPDSLKLVLHLNDQIPYPCPVPARFLVTKASEVATALIQMVQSEMQGLAVQPVLLPFSVTSSVA